MKNIVKDSDKQLQNFAPKKLFPLIKQNARQDSHGVSPLKEHCFAR